MRRGGSTRPGAAAEIGERLAGGDFVGRERELDELDAGLRDTLAGRGRLLLVTGEPGVGKSRLAEVADIRAQAHGFRVLWGRCWEGGGAPPYWPWIQVIRAYLRVPEAADVFAQLGQGAAYIARMVPDVERFGPELEPLTAGESEQERFALFDSLAALLTNAAEHQPLVLILDDLHAADPSSLQALEFVARELRAKSLVVIGTYRDVGARSDTAVVEALGRLGREATTFPLAGLAIGDVARFVEVAGRRSLPESVVRTLHERTAGNPFFVRELVRLLAADGRLGEDAGASSLEGMRVPEGIHQTVAQRVGLLSGGCRDLLATASVVGREFTRAVIERASTAFEPEQLEEAVAAGLVEEVSPAAGRYAFSHALVADTLYERLSFARREELHARVTDALEELYGPDLDPHVAELAHHALAAGEALAERALGYAIRAGERAAMQFAYDEAAGFYERALELKLRSDPSDGLGRCDLSLRMAEMLMKGGRTEHAREVLTETSELARSLGAPAQLARAALTLAAPYAEAGFGDELRAILLEETLRALPDETSALRARVLARLAPELYWAHDFERADRVSAEAVAMARRLEDQDTLGEALDCRHYAILGPDTLEERLELSEELVRLADAAPDVRLQLRGRLWRIQDLLELGAVAAVDAEIEEHGRLALAVRQPGHLWVAAYLRTMRVLLDGRLEEARRMATEAFAIGQRAQIADAAGVYYGAHLYPICRQQGGAEELEEPIRAISELYHELMPGYRVLLAAVFWMLGGLEDARREYERFAERKFELPRDHTSLACQWVLVDLCAAFEDVQGAELLYDLLHPYAARYVTAAFGASCAGSVHYPLGRLAALMSRFEEAESHFEAALEAHARIGARGWAAEAEAEYAAMLLARGEPGDPERARPLVEAARASAAELGWTRVERRCDELFPAGAEGAREPPPPAVAPPAEAVFRLEGDYWTIRYRGEPFRLRDTKGLRLIALLLPRPGIELPVTELVSALEGHASAGEAAASGDAGQLLDPQAKAAYRQRLDALEEELEEARSFNDPERQANAREEIDFLNAELTRAVGLGGRDRRASSAAERARVNVRNLISRAIDKIAGEDPALGHHLQATIRTGRLCSYEPGPEPPVIWTL